MRLLHTSDWHLGRSFHGASLLDDQSQMVDRVVEIAADQGVDLVLVAGDLFDRAIPPAEAVELFDDALTRLRALGATVVAISGNHDSAVRVSVSDRLLAAAGVTVRGDVRRCAEPMLLHPDDGGPPVAVYPIPYLDPPLAGPVLESESRRHDEVTRLALAQVRADLATRGGARSIVVAHTYVTGATTCESERDLSMGNVESVGIDAFAGFDYVALGHLHGRQQFEGGRVAYPGTPLPYSFSEEGHTKSVRVVELAPDGGVTCEQIPVGAGRPLATIEGTLDGVLADPGLAHAEGARVRVLLTDPHLPVQAMHRLRDRFPHTVELRHQPARSADDPTTVSTDRTDASLAPLDLVLAFWAEQHGTEASDAERELLTRALAHRTGAAA